MRARQANITICILTCVIKSLSPRSLSGLQPAMPRRRPSVRQSVLKYLGKYGEASRCDIDEVLMDKLSDVLSEPQKNSKIRNLIYAMSKRDATIQNIGSNKASRWILTEKGKEILALLSDKKK